MEQRWITYDIESTGLLDETSIDYSAFPYKLKHNYKTHCIVVEDIKTNEIFKFITHDCKDFTEFVMDECIGLVGHNILDFDNFSNRLYLGWNYEIQPNAHKRLTIKAEHESLPDRLNGKNVRFIDTLIMSKLLNPDRLGGHSLRSWGKRLKNYKGDYGEDTQNAWEHYSQEMLDYCIQDVRLTTEVLHALMKEMGDYKDAWRESYDLELAMRDIVSTKSSHYGFKVDRELGDWCVLDLNNKLKTIEDKINPLLPERELPTGQQVNFPKNPWKKAFDYEKPFTTSGKLKKVVSDYLQLLGFKEENDQLSYIKDTIVDGYISVDKIDKHPSLLTSSAISYCNKVGIEDIDACYKEILRVETGGALKILTEPMLLTNKASVKEYLVSQGWEATTWNERDLTLDAKKKKRSYEDIKTAIKSYVADTINSPYCKFRCKFLKQVQSGVTLESFLLSKDLSKPIKVISTPKYTKDQEKNLCPGLLKMGSKFSYVQDIVYWLTYEHRRNTLKSPKGTGWLFDKRLDIDGHISTPADTIGAVSGRFTHKKIVNCPRGTSIYGEYMRGILGVEDWCYEIGGDADGLEARQEAIAVYKYEGGREYAEKLIGSKPNDLHTLNSIKFGISRDDAKSLKYMLGYGAGEGKVVSQFGWTKKVAKDVIEKYWEEAKPAKLLIEALTKHWESNGKEFIIGLDKRKLIVRSPHMLLNILLQNGGLVCMKRSHIFLDRWLKEENLLGDPFKHDLRVEKRVIPIIFMHDEIQASVHKGLVRLKFFDTKDDALEYKRQVEDNGKFILSDVNKAVFEDGENKDQWFVGWSRVGELIVKSLLAAGDYYESPIKLTSGYQIGKNWLHCH